MSPLSLYIDYEKCIGCETCEAVCAFIRSRPGIRMTRTEEGVAAPVYCRHCENPACMRACTRGAITRDEDGAVLHNPLVCVTCSSYACFPACPYGAVFVSSRGAPVHKCDLCSRRRMDGLPPACVEMCPAGAIVLITEKERPEASEGSRQAQRRMMRHLNPKPGVTSGARDDDRALPRDTSCSP